MRQAMLRRSLTWPLYMQRRQHLLFSLQYTQAYLTASKIIRQVKRYRHIIWRARCFWRQIWLLFITPRVSLPLKCELVVTIPANLCTICTSLNCTLCTDSELLIVGSVIIQSSTQRGPEKSYIGRDSALRQFKVISGHPNWYQSKAQVRFPISLPL